MDFNPQQQQLLQAQALSAQPYPKESSCHLATTTSISSLNSNVISLCMYRGGTLRQGTTVCPRLPALLLRPWSPPAEEPPLAEPWLTPWPTAVLGPWPLLPNPLLLMLLEEVGL